MISARVGMGLLQVDGRAGPERRGRGASDIVSPDRPRGQGRTYGLERPGVPVVTVVAVARPRPTRPGGPRKPGVGRPGRSPPCAGRPARPPGGAIPGRSPRTRGETGTL